MKNKKGFTLVELLVVVVVLGIITGLSIPLIRNIQESNREREYTTYMDSLKYSAKLYVDSYGEDLFGRHKSGCTLIKYKNMVDKGLLKDIPVDKVSCDSDETFVKVVKMDDKYGYASSIGCGNVKEGKVSIDKKLPKIGLSSSDVCSVDAKTIMSFIAKPAEDLSIKYKKHNIKLTIASDTGINDNMVVYYGFSYNKDSNVINNDWKKLPVTIPGKKSQKDDIYALGILYGIGKAFEDYSNQQSSGTNQNNTESENSGEQKYDSDQENSSEETVQYIGSFTCNPDELTFDAARWTSENYGYEFYTPEDWKRMDNDHQDPSIDIISDKDGNTQMVLAVQDYGRALTIDEIAQLFSKEEDYTVGGIVNINGLEMVYAEWNVDGNPVPQFAFESPNNPGKMLTVCYTCSDPDIAFQIMESFKAI